jgi:hypothetical protein
LKAVAIQSSLRSANVCGLMAVIIQFDFPWYTLDYILPKQKKPLDGVLSTSVLL